MKLLDDMDQITKLEIGELKLEHEYFLLQDLILEIFESFLLRCQEQSIRCYVRKDCDVNILVYADRAKIRQVITNIIDNAIKYGKLNGTVEVSFHCLDKDTALVEIRDDGEGIAEEHRLRIFERFYRTDQARSRKVGGSGLGLAICKHIIEAHQQTIYVRSTLQVGSTFCFSLPLKNKWRFKSPLILCFHFVFYFFRILNSTRRFNCRPDSVLLSAIGVVSPNPFAIIRLASTPFDRRYSFAALARSLDKRKFWLYPPKASVWAESSITILGLDLIIRDTLLSSL